MDVNALLDLNFVDWNDLDDLERLEERLTEQYPADNERQINRNILAAADTVKQEVQERSARR